MSAFNLYIGADNTTGIVDTDLIKDTVLLHCGAFTMVKSVGYWDGEHAGHEASVIVTVSGVSRDMVVYMARDLKAKLSQDAIAIQPVMDLEFI